MTNEFDSETIDAAITAIKAAGEGCTKQPKGKSINVRSHKASFEIYDRNSVLVLQGELFKDFAALAKTIRKTGEGRVEFNCYPQPY